MEKDKTNPTKYRSSGNYSTGDHSTGYRSTGSYSTGSYSTGDGSKGYSSTGNRSTGHYSTGNYSTGSFSTGSYSTGHCSTGSYSTGLRSTGSWSISDYSTGHFSTVDDTGFSVFNKPCSRECWDKAVKPLFIFFDLTEWVEEKDMTDAEKASYPSYTVTKGYLKVYGYKEAWLNAWKTATKKDKKLLYNLPNFDPVVFEEISGIDVSIKKSYKKFIKSEKAKIRLLYESSFVV